MLTCTKCKQEKDESEFYNNRTMPRGKTYWCKVCSNHQSNTVQKEAKARWAARTYQNRKKTQMEKLLWSRAWKRAKDSGMEFDIELKDIIIPHRCPYLDVIISIEGHKDCSPSIDRIDSRYGYIKGNVQVISWKANRIKNDASIEELVEFAKGVLRVHQGGPSCAA